MEGEVGVSGFSKEKLLVTGTEGTTGGLKTEDERKRKVVVEVREVLVEMW